MKGAMASFLGFLEEETVVCMWLDIAGIGGAETRR